MTCHILSPQVSNSWLFSDRSRAVWRFVPTNSDSDHVCFRTWGHLLREQGFQRPKDEFWVSRWSFFFQSVPSSWYPTPAITLKDLNPDEKVFYPPGNRKLTNITQPFTGKLGKSSIINWGLGASATSGAMLGGEVADGNFTHPKSGGFFGREGTFPQNTPNIVSTFSFSWCWK